MAKGKALRSPAASEIGRAKGNNSQEWSTPKLLLDKPGHTIWYPSLQPFATDTGKAKKYTSVKLHKKARLFYKDQYDNKSPYLSEYVIDFKLAGDSAYSQQK